MKNEYLNQLQELAQELVTPERFSRLKPSTTISKLGETALHYPDAPALQAEFSEQ